MRLLTALMLILVVCIGLPTIAAADAEPVAMEQQIADSPVAAPDAVAKGEMGGFDAEVTSSIRLVFAATWMKRRAKHPHVAWMRAGPDGFSPEIWRPVDRADSTPIRNYESGLAIINC